VQLGVGFTFSGSKQEAPTSRSTNRYGGMVYSRHFFGEGNFRPFLGLNASVLPSSSTLESNDVAGIVSTKSNTLDLGANLNAGLPRRCHQLLALGPAQVLKPTAPNEPSPSFIEWSGPAGMGCESEGRDRVLAFRFRERAKTAHTEQPR
jgi:hypothetical protein